VTTGGASRRRDVALRDLVLRLLDSAHGTGTVPIVQAGHPVLRSKALPYDGQLADDELESLVHVMRATMHAAPGVGLAAPQIGLPVAVAVLEDSGPPDGDVAQVRERSPLEFRVLVNPRYVAVDDERRAFYEGCLSVVGYQAVVARPRRVHLVGSDERGRPLDEVLTGWPARIVQHETDHLDGVLYLDRAELRSLAAADALGLRWASEPRPTTAAIALGFELEGLADVRPDELAGGVVEALAPAGAEPPAGAPDAAAVERPADALDGAPAADALDLAPAGVPGGDAEGDHRADEPVHAGASVDEPGAAPPVAADEGRPAS